LTLAREPREWEQFVVEFAERREVKLVTTVTIAELSRGLEGLRRIKTAKTSFSERSFTNGLEELAIASVGTINGFEGDELEGVWREVRGVFLVEAASRLTMLNAIRSATEAFDDSPRPSHRIHQLTNTTTAGVGSGCTTCQKGAYS
jgi:hypothetical protein